MTTIVCIISGILGFAIGVNLMHFVMHCQLKDKAESGFRLAVGKRLYEIREYKKEGGTQ
jgi:hypothetical protein